MGLVYTFTAKGFSETGPLMHLNQHIFRSRSLQKYLNHEAHVFSEDWKLNVDFKVAKEIQEKIYGFLDNLI